MKKRILFAAVISMSLSVLGANPVSAQSDAAVQATQASRKISDIKIKGNSSVSTATILSRLKLKPGDSFEESALNKELKRLYATGFFSDVFVETQENPEGIVVLFTVLEKPVIKDIEFKGNSKLKDAHLLKRITIKKGDLLDFSALNQDMAEIKNYYVEQGYQFIKVDYDIVADKDRGTAVVVFVIDEGMSVRIKNIEVEGNKNMTDGELKKYIATKPAWWFINKGAFDRNKFQADLERIRNLYMSKGFLDAKITSSEEFSDNGREIYLTIIVDEGKKYLIGEIKVDGELSFPDTLIRAQIKIRPGDPFDYSKIREDLDSIKAFYYDRGYMNAEIDISQMYNPTTDRMDLTCKIKSYDEISVGKINVIGNTKTRDVVIRRELRVYPGEKYAGDKLKKSKEKIYDLGFFEDVYFETVPSSQKDVKDLNVTVKETKTGEFSFGGGYSSVDSFIGFVQVRQRNFDIMNFPSFTGAGQDLILRGEMGSTRTNYLLSWTDPWIMGYPYLLGFDLYREEHNKSGTSGYDYDEKRTGGALRLGKDFTDELSAGLKYNLEEVKISDLPTDAAQDLKDEAGTNMISRLTSSLQYDTRDSKYSPTKGWLSGASLENAGSFLGGDKDFVKLYLYTTFYHSFWENVILELKGRTGVVEAFGNTDKVPIYERFFAGGATTLRGYAQRAVGPRDVASHELGGDGMVIGNAEVSFPVYKKLIKGAVFYDVGNVTAKYSDIFSDSAYKQSAGLGVRVKTPIGPVKLDYGYPLSDNHDDKKEGQFWFSVSHGF
ncbi:MAG: outer membrane protein assembly factor BamA [Candidatus Omnitrophota bacterium]|nr:outer membrane protein assembly factor BamA [Candidatus Omnitrophota bacterium]